MATASKRSRSISVARLASDARHSGNSRLAASRSIRLSTAAAALAPTLAQAPLE